MKKAVRDNKDLKESKYISACFLFSINIKKSEICIIGLFIIRIPMLVSGPKG